MDITAPELQAALAARLLALADDELILAHRNSEWTGHGPILEEDIAFANIAQDELGHATVWYELYAEVTDESPDRLAFFRDAPDFRSVQLMELPNDDWAVSMVRQFLFDSAEKVWLPLLMNSTYAPLAGAAAKFRPEELYHYRHTSSWVRRLGLGTVESARRARAAVDRLWSYALQLFVPLPADHLLVEAGIWPDYDHLRARWLDEVRPFLADAGLTPPTGATPPTYSRADHTPHLASLLADMQRVARSDPAAEW